MFNVNVNDKEFKIDESLSIKEFSRKYFNDMHIVAAKIDGNLKDLSDQISKDCNLSFITVDQIEGLEILRHSCAHLLGHALKQIHPEVKMVIGPVINNGFYYDVHTKDPISETELPKIEKLMKKLSKKNYHIIREVVTRDKAIKVFKDRNEDYKLKLIDDIPDGETIAIYHHEEYIDMCRGPHLVNTNLLKHFKLMKVSGSYWRGDSKNQSLQRIYGTAWDTEKSLDDHLKKIEEADKRDHRKLGQRLDLFHFQEESPGMVFWHNNGWFIFNTVKTYITDYLIENNYQIIDTPQILDKSLWQKSGHLDKFSDLIYEVSSEDKSYAIKPMSCPGHIQVFNQGLKSYKDLPLKYAEFGKVHRDEPSGTLHGLLRIRGFTQDDAHIFCTAEQIEAEISSLIDNIYAIYKIFGFHRIKVELSTRPEKRVGSDEIWDSSENALKKALDKNKVDWSINEGDGAFYGPKIDFSLTDSLDREWQLGTIQLDFSMPERLNASYIDKNGTKKIPVMIHRAMLGSIERFVGIIIEEYAGNMPLWLAPTQVAIMNITSSHDSYMDSVAKKLKRKGFRVNSDNRNEKISLKIRENTIAKIPYLVIVGDKELESNTISVRTRSGSDIGQMSVDKFVKMLETLVRDKSLTT
tara:strand:+ start:59 stop:1966 length:1908 start_codon:yes stop_codon:yes gene_type:complete